VDFCITYQKDKGGGKIKPAEMLTEYFFIKSICSKKLVID